MAKEQHGLVLLAFAKSGLDTAQQQSLASAIISPISNSLEPANLEVSSNKVLETSQDGSVRVFEIIFSLHGNIDLSQQLCRNISQSSNFANLENEYRVEFVLQPLSLYTSHRKPGLAVFDMDSTLIQQEVIDELARFVGVYDQVAAITEAAMRGEAPYTDFEASLRARVALLKGVPETVWDELKQSIITFTPGVKEVCKFLKLKGWKLAVLSGGFTPLAVWVKETIDLDYAHANFLESENGVLTGRLVEGKPIVHGQRKQDLLLQSREENGLPEIQTIAVGDGSNDLLMMAVAGLGVAFNAKPKVQLAAPARLNSHSMIDLLYILGYDQSEITETLKH